MGLLLLFLITPLKVEDKIETPIIEYPETSIIIQGNSLNSVRIPLIAITSVLSDSGASGVISDDDPVLACLIRKESGGKERAYNPVDIDGYPRFGLLQYFLPTWKEWCVVRYGLEDNIWNGELHKVCYHLMIKDGQSWRWPAYQSCINETL